MLTFQSGLFYSEILTKIVCALLAYQCNMAHTPHQNGLGHHYIWREIQNNGSPVIQFLLSIFSP